MKVELVVDVENLPEAERVRFLDEFESHFYRGSAHFACPYKYRLRLLSDAERAALADVPVPPPEPYECDGGEDEDEE